MHIPMLVYVLVTAHWIGDWLLQAWSTHMSIKKSTDNWWLTAHVLIVATTLGACTSWFADGKSVAEFVAVNFVAHWSTDYVTSRINAKNWYVHALISRQPDSGGQERWMATLDVDDVKRFRFWTGIGTDQWIHYVTLFATAEWLLF